MGYSVFPSGIGSVGLVYRIFAVIRKKAVVLVLSFAFIVVCFSSCSSILQPSVKDIVKANEAFLKDPVQVQIQLDLLKEPVVAYYTSTVDCFQKTAIWNGKATAYYESTYFIQECSSQTDSIKSAKKWRGQWASKEVHSPLDEIIGFLKAFDSQACAYVTKPISEKILDSERKVYRLMLLGQQVNWNALCDADFNSLFGGKALLEDLGHADVILFVDTQTLLIHKISILNTSGSTWGEMTLTVKAISEAPVIEWEHITEESIAFHEEWSIP